jgi:hypothetical protein
MAAAWARGRMKLWLPLLAVAAGLALFGDKTPAGSARVVASSARLPALAATPPRAGAAPASAPEVLEPLRARRELVVPAGDGTADLFASPRWSRSPPAASAPVAVEAPPPVLPPAYRVLGKKQENEAWELFLGRDDSSYVVRAGDVLDGTWRVEQIDPPTATLVHLPSGAKHPLPIGDAR